MIRVVGRLAGPVDPQGATLVVAGRRHLAGLRGVATVELGRIPDAVAALARHDGDALVVASGDPGFFGIVRALRAAGLPVQVEPGPSAVAVAFARAGVEWDDALVVSAHGRDPHPALAAVRSGRKVAVLTDARTGPAEVAAAAPPESTVVIAERLGAPDERVVSLPPEAVAGQSWRDPQVVLVLPGGPPGPAPWRAGPPDPEPGWALPEERFDHRDGMVTKAEVRALALARLGPRPGVQVWDVGAGSGAVGVECARLGAAVVAVERAGTQRVQANARAFGVRVQAVAGEAPQALAGLPDPDAAFVGGGGPEVVAAVAARGPARVVVTLATLERVAPTRTALAGYDCEVVLLQAARLQPLGEGSRLVPATPVFVVSAVSRP